MKMVTYFCAVPPSNFLLLMHYFAIIIARLGLAT